MLGPGACRQGWRRSLPVQLASLPAEWSSCLLLSDKLLRLGTPLGAPPSLAASRAEAKPAAKDGGARQTKVCQRGDLCPAEWSPCLLLSDKLPCARIRPLASDQSIPGRQAGLRTKPAAKDRRRSADARFVQRWRSFPADMPCVMSSLLSRHSCCAWDAPGSRRQCLGGKPRLRHKRCRQGWRRSQTEVLPAWLHLFQQNGRHVILLSDKLLRSWDAPMGAPPSLAASRCWAKPMRAPTDGVRSQTDGLPAWPNLFQQRWSSCLSSFGLRQAACACGRHLAERRHPWRQAGLRPSLPPRMAALPDRGLPAWRSFPAEWSSCHPVCPTEAAAPGTPPGSAAIPGGKPG